MKVLKKDGRLQDFQIDKLATSITNCASDINLILSDKDSRLLSQDVLNKIKKLRGEEGLTSSYEIRAIMTEMMINSGFNALCNHYNERINL